MKRKPTLARWNFRYSKTALELAVVGGEAPFVDALLRAGADPNTCQKCPSIHLALEARRTDLVRMLLDAGADIETRNAEDRTPLMVAAARGDVDLVRTLLAAGAKKSARSHDTGTAAKLAGINGHVALANELDSSGKAAGLATLAEKHRKERLQQELFDAIRQGAVARVERLLADGADPRASEWGESLLHHASVEDERIVDLLLAAGADPRARAQGSLANPDGTTPLHRAAVWGNDEATRIARRLVAAGANVNARDHSGTTPLAAGAASPEMVETLLELGADPSAVDKKGITVLMRAKQALRTLRHVRADHKEILGREDPTITGDTGRALRTLKVHGAHDRRATDLVGFHQAIVVGRVAVVRRFLDAGADVDGRFEDRTPLSSAAREGWPAVVKLLLERGANANRSEGDDGTTPLMCAAAGGHLDIVTLLLGAGADPSATSTDGRDALSEARAGAREVGQPRRPLIRALEDALAARGEAPHSWHERTLSKESRKAVAHLGGSAAFTEWALGELILLESRRASVRGALRTTGAAKSGFVTATTQRTIADVNHRLAKLTEHVAAISAAEGRRWLGTERKRRKAALADVQESAEAPPRQRKPTTKRSRRVVLLRGERSTLPVLYGFGGWNDAPAPAIIASVLAYWAQTYGAELVDLGNDTLELVVARPPTTARAIARAAHEAFCLCPDVENARAMVAGNAWSFWWD